MIARAAHHGPGVPDHMLKRHNGHEKRQFGRRQTCVNAWIKLRGRAPIPCTVLNISEGGALLEPREPVVLPFRFGLSLDNDGPEIACEVRHQSPNRIGVEFVVAQVPKPVERSGVIELAARTSSGSGVPRSPAR